MGSHLDVAVLKDIQPFAALEKEWEDLYRNAPLATPFQSWAWLYSWWEFYGEGYELCLVTLRDEGLLVGILPLVLKRRWGFGRLLFISTGEADYLDALAREGWEDKVFEAARCALKQLDGWQVADLQQLRPEAAAWGILQEWDGPQMRVEQVGCPIINVKPWDQLVASLSKNHRSTVRRTLRRAEKDGVRRELASLDDVGAAARRWIALHREAWQGRDIAPQHLTEKWGSYAETAALRMIAGGLGRISEFWRDGEVIVSVFWVYARDFVGYYHVGASQEALQRYQVNSLFIWDGVNIARDRNCVYLDTLRGDEPYKLRWTSTIIPTYRVVLSRNPVVWVPYAGSLALQWYIKSESTPQWIRSAAYRSKRFIQRFL